MKKLFLAVCLSVISFTSFSQNTSIGINEGVGHTWMSNMHNTESKFFIFHTYGVSLLQTITPNLAVGADLNYSFEGGNQGFIHFGEIPQSYDEKIRIQFLRLPVKAHWFFGNPLAAIRPSVYLGATVGYLLQANASSEIQHQGPTLYHHQNITELYDRRIDYGMQGGVGLNFKLSPTASFNTSATYYHGLPNTWGGFKKNRNVSLNVGVLWTLAKKSE